MIHSNTPMIRRTGECTLTAMAVKGLWGFLHVKAQWVDLCFTIEAQRHSRTSCMRLTSNSPFCCISSSPTLSVNTLGVEKSLSTPTASTFQAKLKMSLHCSGSRSRRFLQALLKKMPSQNQVFGCSERKKGREKKRKDREKGTMKVRKKEQAGEKKHYPHPPDDPFAATIRRTHPREG